MRLKLTALTHSSCQLCSAGQCYFHFHPHEQEKSPGIALHWHTSCKSCGMDAWDVVTQQSFTLPRERRWRRSLLTCHMLGSLPSYTSSQMTLLPDPAIPVSALQQAPMVLCQPALVASRYLTLERYIRKLGDSSGIPGL